MVNEMLENINNKNYKLALKIFENSFNHIKEEFEMKIYDNNNFNIFEFIKYIGKHTSKEEIISFISIIFSTTLCHYKNGYKYGYYYANKLIKMNPQNIENWEWLLFFYDLPDKLMSKKKLNKILKKVLILDKNNKTTLKLLERMNIK
jgi:hypothetical protein